MASLDSGQSGFLQQEDAGNQVGFCAFGTFRLRLSLLRGRVCDCWASSSQCCIGSCVSHLGKGVLWHFCVKVSSKNTLAESASQVLLFPPRLKWWKSVYLRRIKAGRCLVAVCWRFSRGQFRMLEPGFANLQTLIFCSWIKISASLKMKVQKRIVL